MEEPRLCRWLGVMVLLPLLVLCFGREDHCRVVLEHVRESMQAPGMEVRGAHGVVSVAGRMGVCGMAIFEDGDDGEMQVDPDGESEPQPDHFHAPMRESDVARKPSPVILRAPGVNEGLAAGEGHGAAAGVRALRASERLVRTSLALLL